MSEKAYIFEGESPEPKPKAKPKPKPTTTIQTASAAKRDLRMSSVIAEAGVRLPDIAEPGVCTWRFSRYVQAIEEGRQPIDLGEHSFLVVLSSRWAGIFEVSAVPSDEAAFSGAWTPASNVLASSRRLEGVAAALRAVLGYAERGHPSYRMVDGQPCVVMEDRAPAPEPEPEPTPEPGAVEEAVAQEGEKQGPTLTPWQRCVLELLGDGNWPVGELFAFACGRHPPLRKDGSEATYRPWNLYFAPWMNEFGELRDPIDYRSPLVEVLARQPNRALMPEDTVARTARGQEVLEACQSSEGE